ncbi:hypothetical protein ScPMuIL_014255 [Solemya velum]
MMEKHKAEFHFDLLFFKRFLRLMKLMFPSWCSVTVLLFLFLLALGLLEQIVIYFIGIVPSKYYKVLGEKDREGFDEETIMAVILIVSEAFIKSTTLYVSSVLYITWRGSICHHLHNKYFKGIMYYLVNVLHRIDNPDQRITQDVNKMCEAFTTILPVLIISPFTIAYYTYQTADVSGYLGPVSVLVFFIIASIFNKILMSPVVNYVFQKEKLKEISAYRIGIFHVINRFKHMQIRVNAESAAFFRGGQIENLKTDNQLEKLLDVQHKLIRREYALNFAINISDYVGSILNYIILAFPIFMGVYDSYTPFEISALISKNAFVTIYLIFSFTRLIDMSAQVTDLAGTAHRIGELLELLSTLAEDDSNTNLQFEDKYRDNICYDMNGDGFGPGLSLKPALEVKNLTYRAPNSANDLCRDLSFQLTEGTNILVTGDSGCGKSSLLRVLNRLWRNTKGTIDMNTHLGPNGIIFLPQKPYFTDGSLKQQVVYPLTVNRWKTLDNGKILKYLELVGLEGLLDRIESLDEEVFWNWYDVLSPGEMQRLSFVRLFYHRPRFAVLDESTSQISVDAEQLMYETCKELGITVMSIGHRDSVQKFHDQKLYIKNDGTWTLQNLEEDNSKCEKL